MVTGKFRECDGAVAFPIELAVTPRLNISLVGGGEGGGLEDCPPPQAVMNSPIPIKMINGSAVEGTAYRKRLDVCMLQEMARHAMPNNAVKISENRRDLFSGTPLDTATLGVATETEMVSVAVNC
jgi:hypothetical protein